MRKVLITIMLASTVTWLGWSARAPSRTEGAATVPIDLLYDRDADHIWNRVDRALRVRVAADGTAFGADALDPLLWRETRHMLTPPSHAATLAVLDEFLDTHGERLVNDPVRRATFQRDLWAVFDWTVDQFDDHGGPRHALATRLARMIRRVALTPDQIDDLPDTYSATIASARYPTAYDAGHTDRAFLPPRLLDSSGPWVGVHGDVPEHNAELSRSAFGVHLAAQGGRQATLEYLKKLWDTPEPFVIDPVGSLGGSDLQTTINPSVRPVPRGTQIALVRTMLLVDVTGVIRRTRLVESVQLRVFRQPQSAPSAQGGYNDQDFFEFVLSRTGLFASAAWGLRAVDPPEEAFLTFKSHGFDPFEYWRPLPRIRNPRPLEMCVNCHHELGLASVQSARRFFKPYTFTNTVGTTADRSTSNPAAPTGATCRHSGIGDGVRS